MRDETRHKAKDMLRRTIGHRQLQRTAALFSSSAPVNTPAGGEFKMEAMTAHTRSSFSYKSSDKGEEVGARNEAAYMNYHEVVPNTVTKKFAMPHAINLLTVLPIYGVAFIAASMGWGIFLWDIYARKHYEVVVVERPSALH